MPPKAIPERVPVFDLFTGALLKVKSYYLLSSTIQEGVEVISHGTFVVRYGIPFLDKPYASIIPELVVLDYGDMLTGQQAWEFIINKSNLYPRADILGHCNDGRDEMTMMKKIDLAMPLHIFVYSEENSVIPIAQVSALITTNTTDISKRILDYLPHYSSIADWQDKL